MGSAIKMVLPTVCPAIFLAVFLAMLAAAGPAFACARFPQAPLPTVALPLETAKGSRVFTVELAVTNAQTSCGLMGRESLPENGGMLFDMRPARPAFFWMKNTPLPLDLLFIGPADRVVHIAANAEPFSERSLGTDQPVAAVLEIAGGEAARLGIGLGARVDLPWAER